MRSGQRTRRPAPARRDLGLSRRWYAAGLIALAAIVLVIYIPALGNGFVWDDRQNLVENQRFRGAAAESIRWAFTAFHAGHYQPLTWLSFALDHAVWGMNPRGYHLSSILLHALNTVLFAQAALFLIAAAGGRRGGGEAGNLDRLGAILGAAIFAWHPLRVESVAWVTERRDVLSTALLLGAVLAYLTAWVRAADGRLALRWYLASIGLFALSLLGKALGMALPLALLVIDVYPLARRMQGASWARLVMEKAPLLALSVASGLVALAAQRAGGALVEWAGYGLPERGAQAVYGIVFYIWAMLGRLSWYPMYERPYAIVATEARFVACAAIAAAITILALLLRRRAAGILAAWLCYLVLVAPVLGIAQSGFQLVADRYTYLSCMPLAVLLGAAGAWALGSRRPPLALRPAASVGIAAVLAGWAGLSWRQTLVWRDEGTLWRHALAWGPSAMASNNLGSMAMERADFSAALSHFAAALREKPTYNLPMGNLRRLMSVELPGLEASRVEAARSAVETAVRLVPDDPTGRFVHGSLLAKLGRNEEALAELQRCVELDARDAQAWFRLGVVRYVMRDLPGAAAAAEQCIAIDARHRDGWSTLAIVRLEQMNWAAALPAFEQMTALAPDRALGWAGLARCLLEFGRLPEAEEKLRRALELEPDNVRVRSVRAELEARRGGQ